MVQDYGPSLSRIEENNHKSKWRLHLQCRKAAKEAEVNRVEWEFTNGTGFFRSFRLKRKKRNINELYHLNFQPEFSVFVDKW